MGPAPPYDEFFAAEVEDAMDDLPQHCTVYHGQGSGATHIGCVQLHVEWTVGWIESQISSMTQALSECSGSECDDLQESITNGTEGVDAAEDWFSDFCGSHECGVAF